VAIRITPAMIERAARAIRETFGNRSKRGKPWEALPKRVQDDYRNEAKAALEAALEGEEK
jgi:hypothetical protein